MKTIKLLAITAFFLILNACGGGKSLTADNFKKDTASHKRIAVIPFDSKLKLKNKEKESFSEVEITELEISQGLQVQDVVESFLIGKKLSVRIQSSNITNDLLEKAEINLHNISEANVIELAKILGVDAIVSGFIETEKPMSETLATGVEIAKKIERSLAGSFLGSSINTSTNKGYCKIDLFDGKTGDRLWTFRDEIEMKSGSDTQDIIFELMENGADEFPYR